MILDNLNHKKFYKQHFPTQAVNYGLSTVDFYNRQHFPTQAVDYGLSTVDFLNKNQQKCT